MQGTAIDEAWAVEECSPIGEQPFIICLLYTSDICGIKKNLTFHLARHTFATMSLSKGVPIESVSKMLGHTNIRTTQIYARITNKKIEHDMEQFADKLGKFNTAMGIGENSWQ